MKPLNGTERYNELARFVRNFLEARQMDVPDLANLLHPIPKSRLWDITEGRRTFDGWEVSLFHRRTGLLIPASYLLGVDKYGRRVKSRNPNQALMENLLKEAESVE